MGEELLRPLGRYVLIARLGQGGMGRVFLAVMRGPAGFNKLVVVKTLLASLANKQGYLEMFLKEARISSRLSHPNVVQIYEVAQEGSEYFLVMDYLEGKPLSTLLSSPGKTPLRISLQILLDLLAGLDYAHTLGDFDGSPLNIVHRDISPHNIFVTYQGVSKLLDFGIAQAVTEKGLTKSGVVKGKYAYMSPEQARGEAVDARADIFSLGVILWEVLVGRKITDKISEPVLIAARLQGQEPSVLAANPDAPPGLAAICDRATAHHPQDRFASAGEMRQELEAVLKQHGSPPTHAEVSAWLCAQHAQERQEERSLIERQVRLCQSWLGNMQEHVPLLEIGQSTSQTTGSTSAGTLLEIPTTGTQQRTPRRRRRLWSLLAPALALLTGGLYWGLRADPPAVQPDSNPQARARSTVDRADRDSGQTRPSRAAARTVDQRQPPEHVRLTIAVQPRTASLTLDGQLLPENPYRTEVASDDRAHLLQISAPGHRSETRHLRFDRDLSLEIVLQRQRPPDHSPPGTRRRSPQPQPGADPPDDLSSTKPHIDEENPYQ